MSKKIREEMMSEENHFYVNDGTVLKDLNDLSQKLKNISESTFSHHVNSEKNDFANWTKEVLKDGILARNISKAKIPTDILNAIEKRFQSIEKMRIKKENKKSLIKEIKEAHTNA